MNSRTISASASSKTIQVWDLPVRLFHWALVGTVVMAFVSAEEESILAPWHQPAGWAAAVLILFRLVWGVAGGEHARFSNFLKLGGIMPHLRELLAGRPKRSIGHNTLGGVAIVALLGTVSAIVYTGATMQGESNEDLHEMLANVLLGLIVVHVIAVIAMSILTRENLITAFVTGSKKAASHPGMSDARPPAAFAIPLAVVAIGAAAYGVMAIDPAAFTPGAHAEGSENGVEEIGANEHDDD